MSRFFVVAVAWLVVQSPSIAQACSVCTAGRDEENAAAFLLTTIFMSILPLLAIGTLVFVLWRRIQKLEEATPRTLSVASSAISEMPAISAVPAISIIPTTGTQFGSIE